MMPRPRLLSGLLSGLSSGLSSGPALARAGGRRLHGLLRRFARTIRGAMAVEAVIVLPALMLVMTGFHSFWNLTQTNNALQKAAFTSADLLAREMVPVTDSYLNGLGRVVDYMARTKGQATMRISSIMRVTPGGSNSTNGLTVVWSFSPGAKRPVLTNRTLPEVRNALPLMAVGASIVLVEVTLLYRPVANIGLGTVTLRSEMAVAPRYVPILCRDGRPCDFGN